MNKKNKKYYSKKELTKICENWGLTNIELLYHKSEGWTLYSDQYNDFVAMTSIGFVLFGTKLFKKYIDENI